MKSIQILVNWSLLVIFLLMVSSTNISPSSAASVTVNEDTSWVQYVNKTRMLADIETLASDQYKGRYPATDGDELTLNYINDQLSALNVTALTTRNDFRQPFNIDPWTMPIVPINLVINGETLDYGIDYVELSYTGNASVTNSDLVFAGYGISSSSFNDYSGIDVTGKIVVVCRGVPSGFPADLSYHGYFGVKAQTAFAKGATGMIVFTHPMSGSDGFIKGTLTSNNFIPDMGSICANRTSLELLGLSVTSWINGIDAAYSSGGSYYGSYSLDTEISATLEINVLYKKNAESANIVAKFQGVASGSSERAIIVSGHHDHLGESLVGTTYCGADDDASGVAVVLEVARVLNELYENNSFSKSIIIATWGAEEMGLLGAEHFVHVDPLFPLKQIDLVIQHDMVGVGPVNGYLLVDGQSTISSSVIQSIRQAATQYGSIQNVVTTNDHGSSDHAAFWERNVAAVNFYWDEEHPYLHTPQDTADRINPDILEKVALTTLGYIIEKQNLLSDSNASKTANSSPHLIVTSLLISLLVKNRRKRQKR
ncbi:MAG: M28 family peptidase [Candidatus Odinarchaeota archaeon]